jgi:hypothetical protein
MQSVLSALLVRVSSFLASVHTRQLVMPALGWNWPLAH